MKPRILILAIGLLVAFTTNAQRKVSTGKVQITKTKNAKVLGTDARGNVFDNSNALDTLASKSDIDLQIASDNGNSTTNSIDVTGNRSYFRVYEFLNGSKYSRLGCSSLLFYDNNTVKQYGGVSMWQSTNHTTNGRYIFETPDLSTVNNEIQYVIFPKITANRDGNILKDTVALKSDLNKQVFPYWVNGSKSLEFGLSNDTKIYMYKNEQATIYYNKTGKHSFDSERLNGTSLEITGNENSNGQLKFSYPTLVGSITLKPTSTPNNDYILTVPHKTDTLATLTDIPTYTAGTNVSFSGTTINVNIVEPVSLLKVNANVLPTLTNTDRAIALDSADNKLKFWDGTTWNALY